MKNLNIGGGCANHTTPHKPHYWNYQQRQKNNPEKSFNH
jgi:hypothetical protein